MFYYVIISALRYVFQTLFEVPLRYQISSYNLNTELVQYCNTCFVMRSCPNSGVGNQRPQLPLTFPNHTITTHIHTQPLSYAPNLEENSCSFLRRRQHLILKVHFSPRNKTKRDIIIKSNKSRSFRALVHSFGISSCIRLNIYCWDLKIASYQANTP